LSPGLSHPAALSLACTTSGDSMRTGVPRVVYWCIYQGVYTGIYQGGVYQAIPLIPQGDVYQVIPLIPQGVQGVYAPYPRVYRVYMPPMYPGVQYWVYLSGCVPYWVYLRGCTSVGGIPPGLYLRGWDTSWFIPPSLGEGGQLCAEWSLFFAEECGQLCAECSSFFGRIGGNDAQSGSCSPVLYASFSPVLMQKVVNSCSDSRIKQA